MIFDYIVRLVHFVDTVIMGGKYAVISAFEAFRHVPFIQMMEYRMRRVVSVVRDNEYSSGLAFAVLGVVIVYNIMVPLPTLSGYTAYAPEVEDTSAFANVDAHLPEVEPANWEIKKSYWSQVTVYNSTPEQTDGDPFTTASGERVRDGIVAANCLPFGTKLRMPDLFGDKIFVVKDRLAPGKSCYIIDIWQEVSQNVKSFGAPLTRIEIIERGS